eukprot:scaffold8647_cov40-Prasinocladus_malaysianus.AAC.2
MVMVWFAAAATAGVAVAFVAAVGSAAAVAAGPVAAAAPGGGAAAAAARSQTRQPAAARSLPPPAAHYCHQAEAAASPADPRPEDRSARSPPGRPWETAGSLQQRQQRQRRPVVVAVRVQPHTAQPAVAVVAVVPGDLPWRVRCPAGSRTACLRWLTGLPASAAGEGEAASPGRPAQLYRQAGPRPPGGPPAPRLPPDAAEGVAKASTTGRPRRGSDGSATAARARPREDGLSAAEGLRTPTARPAADGAAVS